MTPFVHPINPSIPALPLVDGCFFIDNTSIEYLLTCARGAEYSLIHKRKSTEEKSALFFGGAIHTALEYRYMSAGKVKPDIIEPNQKILLQAVFEASPIAFDDWRTLSLANQIIHEYNMKYPVEDFLLLETTFEEKRYEQIGSLRYVEYDEWDNPVREQVTRPLVELPFAIELFRVAVPTWVHPSGYVVVIYTGRIDLVVQQGGHLFTVDHKTSSIFGEGFFREQSVNPQHEGYCWAVEKTLGTLPKGFIINAIRTRPPTKGASRPDVSAEDFLRQKTFVDAERIAEWETNTMAIITEFFWKYVRGYYPTERKWCANKYGTCQYFDVCGVPRNNRHMMLYSGMYTTNTWSPLTDAQKILERKRVELMREVIVTGAFDHVSQPILPPKEMTPDDFLNTSL